MSQEIRGSRSPYFALFLEKVRDDYGWGPEVEGHVIIFFLLIQSKSGCLDCSLASI